jgi:hypothetical protein
MDFGKRMDATADSLLLLGAGIPLLLHLTFPSTGNFPTLTLLHPRVPLLLLLLLLCFGRVHQACYCPHSVPHHACCCS